MITKKVRSLLATLNDYVAVALQEAAALAMSATHYKLYPDHLFIKLLEGQDGDLRAILSHFGISQDEALQELRRKLARFHAGNEDIPGYSVEILELLESALLISYVHFGQSRIRSGALIEAYLEDSRFSGEPLKEILNRVNVSQLREDFNQIVRGSVEYYTGESKDAPSTAQDAQTRPESGSALDRFTIDFTAKALNGEIDPVSGRELEIRQTVDILSRRRKNNPMLVGEAGVGKTAVVEGLALRIVAGDVVTNLNDTQLRGLDLGLLQAGASVKGEFENRLKSVINEVIAASGNVILFIDEAHTLIGAGGAAGVGDAANLLKPALARGQLRTIGATTWSEYKQYIESDPALERRFQMVKVDEPDEDTACTMLRGIKKVYEEYHEVTITDSAIHAAVHLSKRYIAGRQLPDKAVDVIDTAAARVNLLSAGAPLALELLEKRKQYLEQKLANLVEEQAEGFVINPTDIEDCKDSIKRLTERLDTENGRWKEQRSLGDRVKELRREIVGENKCNPEGNDHSERLRQSLRKVQNQLHELQNSGVLIMDEVDPAVVASVVSNWTGVPIGRIVSDEAESLNSYEEEMRQNIIGQDHALTAIADSLRVSRSGLSKQDTPIGVFLFVGPSGVGKTETARLTARLLLGDECFMTTINMSEYEKEHTVSQLKGSPPGYVGYGKGGVLTEAVRHRPYTVILLDEVEKAHPNILNLFYQVFDKGIMRDGSGREIDFKNTIIIMTANVGSASLLRILDLEQKPTPDDVQQILRPMLSEYFPTALLARMNIIPFYPLDDDAIRNVVNLKLEVLKHRLLESHRIDFTYGENLVNLIVERCTNRETGARNIDYIIERTILPNVSKQLLVLLAADTPPEHLKISVGDSGELEYQLN